MKWGGGVGEEEEEVLNEVGLFLSIPWIFLNALPSREYQRMNEESTPRKKKNACVSYRIMNG
jgi:hypothetical protein